MRKITYWVLLGAVVYMIAQDPSDTGDLFQAFFTLLGDGFDSFFSFLDALFDSGGDGGGPIIIDPSATPSPLG